MASIRKRVAKRIRKRIRRFRKKRGLSRRILAHLAGIRVKTLKDIEKGKTRPPVEIVIKIAEVLEISLFDLTSKGKHR